MKKIFVCFILLFILVGCININDINVIEQLDSFFVSSSTKSNFHVNNYTEYFDYYLPSDMRETGSDEQSVSIKYNQSEIIMNLNIPSIINSRYYSNYYLKDDGFFNEDFLIYEKSGRYSLDNDSMDYIFKLYLYDDYYVIHFLTDGMNFYATTVKEDVLSLTKHLFTIASNLVIYNNEIVNAYSNKDVIDYQKKQLDLFDDILPSDGDLSTLLIDGAVVGDGLTDDQNDNNNQGQLEIFDGN